MNFTDLADYFEKLEKTSSRLAMTETLARLFKEAPPQTIGKICYLLQGRVVPLYEPVEFGMADKMVMRAISQALDLDTNEVVKVFKSTGDLGATVEKLKTHVHKKGTQLTVIEVFAQLETLARKGGAGSQEGKINLFSDLILKVDALSARYIVRMVLGKLRLGFSDMTILDGLSWMLTGNKKERPEIERAYNVRPDLGYIAQTVKTSGVKGLALVVPVPGTPILMARANRLSSAKEILEKIGTCAVEYKYDGLRLQVHLKRATGSGQRAVNVQLFSRNLEDVTPMFPDIVEAVEKQIHSHTTIIEGEVVAYNPHTGVFVPFQETMQRKRKYNIAEKAAEIPVKLFVFELLFADGKSYLHEEYSKRKQKLKEIVKNGEVIKYAQETIAKTPEVLEKVFNDSIAKHFEGIMAKKLNGVYEAGVRGWNWIKYKKAMNKKLNDTIDVLVMGYTKGEGKRTAFGVGQFLTGVYDAKHDKFVTVSKIGTGLTDEQFREFFRRVKQLETKEKPVLYETDKLLDPDIWLTPQLVVEVSCDEITRSAVHTAGRIMEPSKSGKAWVVKTAGFALRFPRLERFRDDKRPEDVTTIIEINHMYQKQGNK